MKFKYKNKRITGVLTVIPKNYKTFDEEISHVIHGRLCLKSDVFCVDIN